MRYQRFIVGNYKAIKDASIDLSAEGLVLLLGINESGKTSVLRAIESFDYTNDPEADPLRTKFYKTIRNKKELNSTASISAEILLEDNDLEKIREIFKDQILENSDDKLRSFKKINITRSFKYQNAEFLSESYSLDQEIKNLFKPEFTTDTENALCKNLLGKCPSIQYFEDFKESNS